MDLKKHFIWYSLKHISKFHRKDILDISVLSWRWKKKSRGGKVILKYTAAGVEGKV